MKKLISLLISLLILISGPVTTSHAASEAPAEPVIGSESGIVMDVESKAVLSGKNIHKKEAPSSITKLLTALVVAENANPDEMVTFTEDAFAGMGEGAGNKNALEPGDQMTVRDCLSHMLLVSSNQSANALAVYVSGSREAFVEMMNKKVQDLGLENSHFANPSGLDDETQYTTAYDMALIGIAAYENPLIAEISSSVSYQLPKTAGKPKGGTIRQEHRMMLEDKREYYPGVAAGKTGYSVNAGSALLTYADKDGRRLIAVTLKNSNLTHYEDTKALLDFGFKSQEPPRL